MDRYCGNFKVVGLFPWRNIKLKKTHSSLNQQYLERKYPFHPKEPEINPLKSNLFRKCFIIWILEKIEVRKDWTARVCAGWLILWTGSQQQQQVGWGTRLLILLKVSGPKISSSQFWDGGEGFVVSPISFFRQVVLIWKVKVLWKWDQNKRSFENFCQDYNL